MLHDVISKNLNLEVDSGRSFCVALSGGSDSVALLRTLVELQKRFGFQLSALHLNFNLRGSESDRDEKFVRGLCRRSMVPLIIESVSIQGKTQIQEQCRDLRHAAYRKLDSKMEIIEGHHADDQIETFFLRLFRGAGLEGLAGMSVERVFQGQKIWRPLLEISKDLIVAYCRGRRWSFRVDSSNRKNLYDRNYIRRVLIPKIRQRFPHSEAAILRTMQILRGANEALATRLPPLTHKAHIDWESLRVYSETELSYFWKQSFRQTYGLTLSFRQIRELVLHTQRGQPFSFNAPKGIIVRGRPANRVDKPKIDIILK